MTGERGNYQHQRAGPDMGAMMADLAAKADAASKEMEYGMEDMVKKVKAEEEAEKAKKK